MFPYIFAGFSANNLQASGRTAIFHFRSFVRHLVHFISWASDVRAEDSLSRSSILTAPFTMRTHLMSSGGIWPRCPRDCVETRHHCHIHSNTAAMTPSSTATGSPTTASRLPQQQPQAQQPSSNSSDFAAFESWSTHEIQGFGPTPFNEDDFAFEFGLTLPSDNFLNTGLQMESLFLVWNDF